MEGRQNESKNATPLKDWVERMKDAERKKFASDNYFPKEVNLDFKDFKVFYEKRKELLRGELRKVLAVTSYDLTEDSEEWRIRDEEIGDIGDRAIE